MQIALHSKRCSQDTQAFIAQLMPTLAQHGATLRVSPALEAWLQSTPSGVTLQPYTRPEELAHADLIMSLGGDGTLLEAVHQVGATEVPILGINTGRMGFLATVAQAEALTALERFLQGHYTLEARTLLQVEAQGEAVIAPHFALNEVALLKQDSAAMMAIQVAVDEGPTTTYWGDGLIIATPTGSTGYSLSCGGPVILPDAHSFVITPVAPHNLSVRPLVVPHTAALSLQIESRNHKFLVTLDGRSSVVHTKVRLGVKKAPFQAHLVQTNRRSIFDALRQKLHWGLDVRN